MLDLRKGFRAGRIFGIEIRIDPSWILIFALLTWNLATTVFESAHPDWSPLLAWTTAATATVLLFASVLTHELAHALIAKSKGLPIRNITLFMFGGVSNLEREPSSAGAEFVIAIVGPITSVALGVLFLILGGFGASDLRPAMDDAHEVLQHLGPVTTLLLWLGPVNIALGIFNMVPGFPLDGGRVLRSILWVATGDLQKATRWAAAIGSFVAWAFIVAGISMAFGLRVPYFGTGFAGGLWLALIGWFLLSAAQASYQRVLIEAVLRDVTVSRLMRDHVPTVGPDLEVGRFVDDFLMRMDERAFPVVVGDRLAGIVCLEDIRRIPRASWDTKLIRDVMTPADRLEVVAPDDDAAAAFSRITARDIRQLPVVDHGHLVGVLRRRDLVRYLQLQLSGA